MDLFKNSLSMKINDAYIIDFLLVEKGHPKPGHPGLQLVYLFF